MASYEGSYGSSHFGGASAEGTMTGEGGEKSESDDGNTESPPAMAHPHVNVSKASGGRPGQRSSVQRSPGVYPG